MFPTLAWMRRSMFLWAAGAVLSGAIHASAQQAIPTEAPPAAPPPTAEAPKPEEPKPDFPKFEEVAKDHEKLLGPAGEDPFFPLYYNKKTDHLLCVVPKAMLTKNFLLASSIAGGPRMTGFMWNDLVVQWHEMDKKLVLIEPDVRYKTGEKSTVEDVIKRTYTERILLATPIVSQLNGDPVIDLDKVFKSNFMNFPQIFGGNVDPTICRWAKRKAFPNNVEVAVDLALMDDRGQGGQRSRVHYSISKLPENDYQPRHADDRIGYFLTAVKDWSKPHTDKTVFDRYINRWRLRKENSEAEVSDVKPEDQIVFYIEKTVPKELRVHVREGILEWNKAFEKIGLRNAVAVRQQTDTLYAEIDPEDVRYNFFRWIVSGQPFAMGPSRVNPLTGQILDADIIFDDSFIRSLQMQYARLSPKTLATLQDPQAVEFLTRYPEWDLVPQFEQFMPPSQVSYAGVDMVTPAQEMARTAGHQPTYCTYATGMVHELCLGQAVLDASGQGGRREEFIGQMLKEVVAHEVGHTLGLRHNFKASSWLPLDKIMSNKDDAPICASVMDYAPAMYTLNEEDQGNFVTASIGPYDYWAIEYGYRTTDATLKTEADVLKAATSRVAEPGLAYGTDEDSWSFQPDPLVNTYDNGDDPIVFAKQRMEMVQALFKDVETWAVEDGESYNRLRKTFDMLLFELGRASRFVARNVGGQYVSRDYKGDPNGRVPFEIVPVDKQRAALSFLTDTIFSDRMFDFDAELLNRLAAGRMWHWDSDAYDSQVDYPVHERIAGVQNLVLFQLMNPFTIHRVHDAEIKVPADQEAMTVAELMTKTTAAIWSELNSPAGNTKWTDRKPFVSSIRRGLQRRHLDLLINNIVLREPGMMMPADAHSLTRMILRGLSAQIEKVAGKESPLDDPTRAHLLDSKARIDKALEAEFTL